VSIAVERFSPRIVGLLQVHQVDKPENLEQLSGADPGPSTDTDISGLTPSPIIDRLLMATFRADTDYISNIAMAPKTNLLAWTSSDMLVRLWDAVTGTLIHTVGCWPEFARVSVISLDHGYIVTALGDGAIAIEDFWYCSHPDIGGESARPTPRVITGCSGAIHAIAISSDSKRIAAAYGNKKLMIWDLETDILEMAFKDHPDTMP
jgi:WD40 repeat protein